jgi:hypothetical protein
MFVATAFRSNVFSVIEKHDIFGLSAGVRFLIS